MEIRIEKLYRGFLIVEQSDEPIQIKKYGTENAEQTIKTIKSILGIPEPSLSWLDLNQKICMPDEPDPTPSPGETPGQGQKTQPPVPNILKQDILIRRFEYDHSLRKSIPDYKNTWYAELPDGRVVLGYGESSYYTTKESVMKIQYPVPYGYFKGSDIPSTAWTCLRAYRDHLGLQPEDCTQRTVTQAYLHPEQDKSLTRTAFCEKAGKNDDDDDDDGGSDQTLAKSLDYVSKSTQDRIREAAERKEAHRRKMDDCKGQTKMSEKTKKLREMTIKMGIQ